MQCQHDNCFKYSHDETMFVCGDGERYVVCGDHFGAGDDLKDIVGRGLSSGLNETVERELGE